MGGGFDTAVIRATEEIAAVPRLRSQAVATGAEIPHGAEAAVIAAGAVGHGIVAANASRGVARVQRAAVQVVARWTVDGEGGEGTGEESNQKCDRDRQDLGAWTVFHSGSPMPTSTRTERPGGLKHDEFIGRTLF